MDATTPQPYPGGRIVFVEGLLGRLLGRPSQSQPVGEDKQQWIKATVLQSEGIPFGFTTYRPSDITGKRPWWYEFGHNVGDIDTPPLGFPMGPRHLSVPGLE